jgi:hypothetical protein
MLHRHIDERHSAIQQCGVPLRARQRLCRSSGEREISPPLRSSRPQVIQRSVVSILEEIGADVHEDQHPPRRKKITIKSDGTTPMKI